MAELTKIEWTDATWNPIRAVSKGALGWHCEKISPGCVNCYAEQFNFRMGTKASYSRVQSSHGGVVSQVDPKALAKPLSWRKPRRVFVCSMTDLFGEWLTDAQIDQVLGVIAVSHRHTFQVLTKRPGRMVRYFNDLRALNGESLARRLKASWSQMPGFNAPEAFHRIFLAPLENLWLGVSVENQAMADLRLPQLQETPAAIHFVSAEPLLSAVDLWQRHNAWLDWVIVGGESGRGARPCDVQWIRNVKADCKVGGVACFVKQLGSHVLRFDQDIIRVRLKDPKGGDPAEWPEDLRVREYPR